MATPKSLVSKAWPTWLWWTLFVVSTAATVGCIYAFGWRGERLAEFGLTVAIPDTKQGMTPGYLHYFGWELGEVGRRFYIWTQLAVDTLFPLAYASVLICLARVGARGAMRRLLYGGALLAASFDLLENLLVVIALAVYPNAIWLAWPATFFTSLKLFFLVVTLAVAAPLALLHGLEFFQSIINRLRNKTA